MMVNFLSWLFEDRSKVSPRDVYSKRGQCLLRDRVLTKCILGDSFCFEVSGRRPGKSWDFPVAGGDRASALRAQACLSFLVSADT